MDDRPWLDPCDRLILDAIIELILSVIYVWGLS